jgi:DNA polymerase elongation subunit (family B)
MTFIEEIRTLQDDGMGLRKVAEFLGTTYGKVRYAVEQDNNARNSALRELMNAPERTNSATPGVVTYVWDLETTDLTTFFGKLIVAAFLNVNTGEVQYRNIYDFKGNVTERETQLLHWTLDRIEEADILIGHNTLAFDLSFLRGRLAIHNIDRAIAKRQHWDTLQIAKFGFKGRPQGYSLENLLDFFQVGRKDKPSKHDWAASVILDEEAIGRITDRCIADVEGNNAVWNKLRPYFHAYKGK